MALYLKAERPSGPLMVRRRSPVQTRVSASFNSPPSAAWLA
jgi:hypothetical protein